MKDKDTKQSKIKLVFYVPQERWEAELALRSLDLAFALNDLSYKRSEHKHEQTEKEYEFWDRFSSEVNKVLTERNVFDLVVNRMQ